MSLKLEHSLAVNATPEAAWRVFAHVELWSTWDPGALRSARWTSGEPWALGSTLEIVMIKPLPFTLVMKVSVADSPAHVQLTGEGSGVDVEQNYYLAWNAATSATEMRTIQEFSGMAVTFFGDQVKKPILDGIARIFEGAKREAESVARP
jgi:hypothetical protein